MDVQIHVCVIFLDQDLIKKVIIENFIFKVLPKV